MATSLSGTTSPTWEMVGKIWDMKALDMKAKDGMVSPQQVKELQKILGRSVGA